MAYDGVGVTEGSGETVATDLIATKQYQRVKVAWGAEGTATEVAAATPLPVEVGAALPAGTNNIGDVDVASVALPTALYHGQTTVTTAGTEVALASSQAILSGVTVKALSTNTGLMYIGGNPVTSGTGFELAAGEQVSVEIDDPAKVYIDASVSGEKVSWIAS